MDSRLKKFLVGFVVGIVLFVVLILLITRSNHVEGCNLTDDIPKPVELKNVKSENNKYLARFAGYFKFAQNEQAEKFLSANLKSLDLIERANYSTLNLKTDCSSIEFHLGVFSTSVSKIVINAISLENRIKQCQVNDDPKMSWTDEHHYLCRKTREYKCIEIDESDNSKTGEVLGSLFVTELEFELNGKENNVKDELFTSTAKICD